MNCEDLVGEGTEEFSRRGNGEGLVGEGTVKI